MTIFTSRVIVLFNKKTSIRLSLIEWDILDNICRRENLKRNKLIEKIMQSKKPEVGMTQAVRLFVLVYLYRQNLQSNPIFFTRNQVLTATLMEISQ
ncbi:MAG: ribbon-helix-helix domain-containing protein [Alphaproteobacteria bacterium]|nr:ribbon-helix-helix domain-containing protein [Alphaproteobacteria bacterium]